MRKIIKKILHVFISRLKFAKTKFLISRIFFVDFIKFIFQDKDIIRYNVYGWSSNSDKYIREYRLLDFFPCNKQKFILSSYKPQIQFFEPLGNYRKNIEKKSTAMKIFATSECVHSKVVPTALLYEDNCINDVDISMGFDYINNDNYIRYPYWLYIHFPPTRDIDIIAKKVSEFNERKFRKTKYCALIASHDKTKIREKLHTIVSHIDVCPGKGGGIDCPSLFMHNDDSLLTEFHDSKEEYLKQYMFNICPENDVFPGYVTEKIFDALWASCIPIYYGGERVPEPLVINPNAYIFLDPENPQEAQEKISSLYKNHNAFENFLAQPKLLDTATDFIFDIMKNTYSLFEEKYKKYFSNGKVLCNLN